MPVIVDNGKGTRDGIKPQIPSQQASAFFLSTVDTSIGTLRMTSSVTIDYRLFEASASVWRDVCTSQKKHLGQSRDLLGNRETRVSLFL